MTRIRRGGRELTVSDSSVAEYLKEGYSVIDDKGNEVRRGMALNYGQAMAELAAEKTRTEALASALAEANAKVASLAEENSRLAGVIETMQASMAASTEAEKTPEEPEQTSKKTSKK